MSPLESFRLTVFRVVAERLNFTQAAEVLHITQPSVTSHVKALEEEVGVRLFDRSATGVSLTVAGARLRDFAIQVNRLSQEALRDIAQLSGELRDQLSLGASTTIAQYLLPRLLAGFLEQYPRVELTVSSGNTDQIVTQLVQRRIQLGLTEGPVSTSDLKVEPFLEDEIVAVASSSDPLFINHPAPTLSDIAERPLLMRESGSGTRRVVEDALRAAGIGLRNLHIRMELDSTEAIKSAIEAGLGIGFLSRWALRNEQRARLAVLAMDGFSIKRIFQFVYPHGPDPEGAAGAFLRFARGARPELSCDGAGF
ncbi:MAG TPA: LysR substrate-binding domain-containing protein [Candidatus Binataceae bacterium]|nr:LysR substrate-binding domain-containing protein [Candidatus Binataceae bacterium]